METTLSSISMPRKHLDHYSDLSMWKINIPDYSYNLKSLESSYCFGKSLINISTDVSIKIGDESIMVPNALIEIVTEIEDSRSILDFQVGWDDNMAHQISREIWETSALFLLKYSNFIYKNLFVLIDAPEINPCPDGSIDISWRTTKARMLINFRKDDNNEILAYFYGDTYDNKMSIKGTIPTKEVEIYLAVWMKNLI